MSCWLVTTIQALYLTCCTQIFCNSLKVHHQLAIICNILTDLIHQKNHMMMFALAITISANTICKFFHRQTICILSILCPVICFFFRHDTQFCYCLNNLILNEIIIFSCIFPRRTINFFEFLLKSPYTPSLSSLRSNSAILEWNGTTSTLSKTTQDNLITEEYFQKLRRNGMEPVPKIIIEIENSNNSYSSWGSLFRSWIYIKQNDICIITLL